MTSKYDQRDRQILVGRLQRDAERQLGLMWERLRGAPDEGDTGLAAHPGSGLGHKRGERDFFYLRELGGRLQSAGSFDLDRMRFA